MNTDSISIKFIKNDIKKIMATFEELKELSELINKRLKIIDDRTIRNQSELNMLKKELNAIVDIHKF